ncbi:MAG: CoA transferase, partial [Chloroflexota bacterium]|nr:CoA transferase [Chloroflexota bacterium]
MSQQPLSGLKVIEWAELVSGPYCGKLLADLGAEVIKLETPGLGDRARARGPFPGDLPHPEKSGTFLYLNTNKLGVTLNVECASGVGIFRKLIEQADVLVENHPPSVVERLGLTFNSLSEVNPRLVMTSISAFGQTGPYRDYKSCNLVGFNTSGMAYLNPSDGVDDIESKPPLMGPPNQGDLVAGLTGAVATMSAVLGCQLSGEGQHVDVSQQEAIASVARHQIGNYTVEQVPWIRHKLERPTAVSPMYRCKDGLVYLICNQE